MYQDQRNIFSDIINDGKNMYREYFQPRNAGNRYRKDCIIPDIIYNMISSRDILKQPDQYKDNLDHWDEMVDKPYMSRLPLAGKYINAYKKEKNNARMGACAINALDEAGSSDEAPDFDRVSEGMEIYYYLFFGAFILSSFLAMYKMLRYRKETPEK